MILDSIAGKRRARWLRKRGPVRTVRKTCRTCKQAGYYEPTATRCRQLVGMKGSWACWGQLQVSRKASKKGDTMQPDVPKSDGQKARDAAAKKLAHAQRMVAKKRQDMSRLARQSICCGQAIAQWERRQNLYAKRSSMTDAEVQAERDRRLARPAKPRRGIKIGGAL